MDADFRKRAAKICPGRRTTANKKRKIYLRLDHFNSIVAQRISPAYIYIQYISNYMQLI